MKKVCSLVLACLLLSGCGAKDTAQESVSAETGYSSQFVKETRIALSDEGITVEGNQEAVTTSHDIIYYEDRDTYDSGYPYGEGTSEDRHPAGAAASHTVVNITRPGAYRLSGKLSAGQIRVDLGEGAYSDPDAVVELILDNADISCTVAPAILFLNVYECDGDWSVETAKAEMETSAAGANLILEGSNTVQGSYVAKIYRDGEGEKKLWKQDGAIYSYMSMNVYGPGTLELAAGNEGLDTELHLTIHGGDIQIRSGNDGINTNEDGVSVTTINGGNLTIFAGLGKEGDGIDSNGYLVINGGRVFAAANPAADAGLDSDLGSYIHGGTVIALGAAMDWAESDSRQVTMNLQFARQQSAGTRITVAKEDGTEMFSFRDEGSYARAFTGVILSHPELTRGAGYQVLADDVLQSYTGSDLGPGMGGPHPGGERPELPENFEGELPEHAEGEMPRMPKDFQPGQQPEQPRDQDRIPPEDFGGQPPEAPETGTGSTIFRMTDQVNAFTGIDAAQ